MAAGSWPKGYLENSYGWMWEGYNQVEGKVDTLFDVKNDTEGVFDQSTTGIAMGVLEQKSAFDESVTFRRPSEGFTAYSALREFKDGISLGRVEVERFPKSKVRNLLQDSITSWGNKMKVTEERFAATLFTKGGFTGGHDNFKNVIPGLLSQNTDGLAYDAKPFFNRSDNTRTSKGGGTYYNAINSALTQTNFATLHDLIFVTNAYDERDEEVELEGMGRKVLLIPPQLRDEAFSILSNPVVVGAPNDQASPWKGMADLETWGYLRGNATAWYLGIAKKGINFYRAGKPVISPSRDPKSGAYNAYVAVLNGWMAHNWRFWGASGAPLS